MCWLAAVSVPALEREGERETGRESEVVREKASWHDLRRLVGTLPFIYTSRKICLAFQYASAST